MGITPYTCKWLSNIEIKGQRNCTSDLIFFNSGALPNILHYITLHYKTGNEIVKLAFLRTSS